MIPGTRDIIFPTQAGQSYQINGGAQFTSSGPSSQAPRSLVKALADLIPASMNTVKGLGLKAIPPHLIVPDFEPAFLSGDCTEVLTSPYEGMVIDNSQIIINSQVYCHQTVLNCGLDNTWARFSIIHPGDSDNTYRCVNRLRKRSQTVEYHFLNESTLRIDVALDGKENKVNIALTAQGELPWISLKLEKKIDFLNADLAKPVVKLTGKKGGQITQALPGGHQWQISADFPAKPRKRPFDVLLEDYRIPDGTTVSAELILTSN
jgi:hypothetical protein